MFRQSQSPGIGGGEKPVSNALGIDVSAPGTDWKAWHEEGVRFACIKATQSVDYVNPAFKHDWAAAGAAGMRRIAYHYGDPSTDPAGQAAALVETVKGAGLESNTAFALDLETYGTHQGMTPVEVAFWGYVFCAEVRRLAPKHWVFVYCSPSFADTGACYLLGHWPLWVAHWGVAKPEIPLPWKRWVIWQYASGGAVDHDRFNGDEAELDKWF